MRLVVVVLLAAALAGCSTSSPNSSHEARMRDLDAQRHASFMETQRAIEYAQAMKRQREAERRAMDRLRWQQVMQRRAELVSLAEQRRLIIEERRRQSAERARAAMQRAGVLASEEEEEE